MNSEPIVKGVPHGFERGVALNFAGHFTFLGIYLPFFPLWLEARGLTPSEIGIVLAAVPLARIPLALPLGACADAMRERARMVALACLLVAFAMTAHAWAATFWTILALHMLLAVAWVPHLPVVDAIALTGMRRDASVDYGRLRSWGSIVFLVSNLAGGWAVLRYGPTFTIVSLISLAWFSFAATFALPRLGRPSRPPDRAIGALLSDRPLVLVLLGAGLVQGSHAMLYGFGSVHWNAQGFDGRWIGIFWAIGVVAEILLFRILRGRTGRLGAGGLMLLGAAGAIGRWTLMVFEPGLAATALLQVSHVLSFGCAYLGQQLYVGDRVPERQAAGVQGLATVSTAVSFGLGTLVSGPLYDAFGAGAFAAMGIMCAAGLAIVWLGLQPHSGGAGGATVSPA